MAVLDGSTLFVSYLSSNACKRKYESDLLREIGDKKLVKTRVTLTIAGGPSFSGLAEHTLTLNSPRPISDYYRVPVDVIFGQLLAARGASLDS